MLKLIELMPGLYTFEGLKRDPKIEAEVAKEAEEVTKQTMADRMRHINLGEGYYAPEYTKEELDRMYNNRIIWTPYKGFRWWFYNFAFRILDTLGLWNEKISSFLW